MSNIAPFYFANYGFLKGEEKLRCGDKVYKVYMEKGEVIVRKGKIHPCNPNMFVPDDKPHTYHTKNPSQIMKIEAGKVYCVDESDIPKAIEMVKRHHDFYLEEAEDRLNRAKSGGPMYKRTKDDSPLICPRCKHQFNMGGKRRHLYYKDGIDVNGHKFMKSECYHCGCEFYFCNASAEYARECRLKCVYEKNEFERMICEMKEKEKREMARMKVDEAIEVLQDALKDLERKDARQKELEEDGSFTFVCTEAEFKAIKHALERLYIYNRNAINPISTNPAYRRFTCDELYRMKVENAVIGDLMDAIDGVDKEGK